MSDTDVMEFTRRIFFSGAMAAPLLGQLGGGAATAAEGTEAGTAFALIDGLSELRLTTLALERLREEGIEVQAVAPASEILGADGSTVEGVTMPPEYGRVVIDLSGQPTDGRGRVRGGVRLRSEQTSMEITEVRGDLSDGRIFAFLKVNEDWVGEVPLYATDPAAVRLDLRPGAPTKPTTLRGSDVPITPTEEGLAAFEDAFGTSLFTATDVVLRGSGEAGAWPVPSWPDN
ncbi:hypothetical protein FB471_6625 [Amycolatopsis cihanbeyliensis]|uniref:Uncharacterized protein n=2 Tax=Amycolatopsis cihanbeyliensis TaxID=1128664 RepID=A0A542CUI8_AMYCI|nr:hypothetical protein FB471_6625 [Amycolatopsis cihanbeyliensis]